MRLWTEYGKRVGKLQNNRVGENRIEKRRTSHALKNWLSPFQRRNQPAKCQLFQPSAFAEALATTCMAIATAVHRIIIRTAIIVVVRSCTGGGYYRASFQPWVQWSCSGLRSHCAPRLLLVARTIKPRNSLVDVVCATNKQTISKQARTQS